MPDGRTIRLARREVYRMRSQRSKTQRQLEGKAMKASSRTVKASGLEPAGEGTVQALDRALQLLELLATDSEGYRLVDLAACSGLSASTAHRLLTTLEQRRFVQFDRDTSLWHVGARCFSVGAAFARRRRIQELALPVMRRLREQTRVSVNLGLADAGEVIFVGQLKGPEASGAVAELGRRVPLHGAAMGQAILAAWSEDDVAHYLRTHGLLRLTPHTVTRPSRLYELLASIRRSGYAVDDEQHALGLRCVAATICDEHGQPFAALSVAGPSHALPSGALAAVGEAIRAASAEISAGFGGRADLAPSSIVEAL